MRWLLWLHASLWCLFALAVIVTATTSPEARGHPVFIQVAIACLLAAVGAVASACYRIWGVLLLLCGAAGVLAAWIAGDSGDPYRYYVGGAVALFLLAVAVDHRAFVTPRAR